jgi:hypothetical protein
MLVHFSYPYGSTIIDGKRIYGYLERYDPVKVPWETYKAYRGTLIQVPYSKRTLEKMFPGREFPNITFTFSQIRSLSWDQMCDLCKAFGFTSRRSNESRRRKLRKFIKYNC